VSACALSLTVTVGRGTVTARWSATETRSRPVTSLLLDSSGGFVLAGLVRLGPASGGGSPVRLGTLRAAWPPLDRPDAATLVGQVGVAGLVGGAHLVGGHGRDVLVALLLAAGDVGPVPFGGRHQGIALGGVTLATAEGEQGLQAAAG
jgi:hypothetical protein